MIKHLAVLALLLSACASQQPIIHQQKPTVKTIDYSKIKSIKDIKLILGMLINQVSYVGPLNEAQTKQLEKIDHLLAK